MVLRPLAWDFGGGGAIDGDKCQGRRLGDGAHVRTGNACESWKVGQNQGKISLVDALQTHGKLLQFKRCVFQPS